MLSSKYNDTVAGNLPGKELFKTMGLRTIDPQNVFNQILKSFQLD